MTGIKRVRPQKANRQSWVHVRLGAMDPAQAAADWEKLRTWEMPFGKFSGRKLYDLPAEYLCWFEQKGWPSGDLGRLLQIVLEAKRQGADHAFAPLRK
jgi:uncharacterized protein (DUF3820 family)